MAKYRLKLGGKQHEVEVEEGAEGVRVRLGDEWRRVSFDRIGDSAQYALIVDGRPYEVFAEQSAHGFEVVVDGLAYSVETSRATGVREPTETQVLSAGALDEEWVVISPMAGVVQKLLVALGDNVETGDVLLVIEAMKMQNELRAHRSGQVRGVYVSAGQQVEPGTPLLVFL